MIDLAIINGITGKGPLQAEIRIPPMDQIQLRPNVIFDIAYDKRVVHLGCTDHLSIIDQKVKSGVLLHQQLTRIAAACLGVDINREATRLLRRLGITNIIVADITQPDIPDICNNEWDFLLMAEMLEHIDDPVAFLKCIALHYREQLKNLIITVPNAFGFVQMAQVFYHGTESINHDHRYWFTPYTLCKVAHQAGLVLDDLIMCVYENSVGMLKDHRDTLSDKPILLDTIVLVAHWK